MLQKFQFVGQDAQHSIVWIIGSSIPYWAGEAASRRPGGRNLGLERLNAEIVWITKRGMKWAEFDAMFESELRHRPVPNFLLIHLGANDLVTGKSKELIENIKCSFLRIKVLSPSTNLIWSEMLSRRYWHETLKPVIVEKARKRVNCAIRSFMKEEKQFVIRYPSIKASDVNLFRQDGTHLSPIGIGLYLNNIQAALEIFLSRGIKIFPNE